MRVARLHAWGDVRVEEAAVPAVGPGEALIRIEACGVCGSDALDWYVERKAPVVLGHEPAGEIVAVGAGVEHVRPGDRVFVHHHAPCGACAECRRHLWSSCATWRASRLEPGGFAEYARIPATNLARDTLRLPDAMDYEMATFIEPVACCIRAVRRGRTGAGDCVLVIGLGAMGLVMIQLARLAGAAVVAGSDLVPRRRELGLALGADFTLDPAAGPVADAVRERSRGRGADVVLVCPGTADAVHAAIAAAAPGGRVVCFTPLPPDSPLALDACELYFREVQLRHSYSCGPDETRRALRLLEREGRTLHPPLRVRSLITHRAGLDGVAAALERAKRPARDAIKSVILPHGEDVEPAAHAHGRLQAGGDATSSPAV
jgi:L-iditol 2-dehydrogenase